MDVEEFAELAKKKLSSILGKKIYGISAMTPESEGWSVEIEAVEEEHLASAYDIIGVYEAHFDKEGDLLKWNRKSLRQKG